MEFWHSKAKPWKHDAKWNDPDIKGSFRRNAQERQFLRGRKQSHGCQGLGRENGNEENKWKDRCGGTWQSLMKSITQASSFEGNTLPIHRASSQDHIFTRMERQRKPVTFKCSYQNIFTNPNLWSNEYHVTSSRQPLSFQSPDAHRWLCSVSATTVIPFHGKITDTNTGLLLTLIIECPAKFQLDEVKIRNMFVSHPRV